MRQIIQQQIDKITSESSSIYSKEDVIKMLTLLTDSQKTKTSSIEVDELLQEVYNTFMWKLEEEETWQNLVKCEHAEFKIEENNKITLDYIRVREDYILSLLEDSINEKRNSYDI